jgi:antitoxin component HigA of HigAB toxin-antitoxin module
MRGRKDENYTGLLKYRPDLISRIHSYIVPSNFDDCWNWMKEYLEGYATFRWGYKGNKHRIQVHRFLWYLATGQLPEVVKHLCNNKSCVNIHHLQGDTLLQNIHDAMNDGLTKGDPLSPDDVRQIHILRSQGLTLQAIADVVGTAKSYVCQILSGKKRPDIYKEFHP